MEDDRKKDDSEDDFWRDPLSFLSSGSSTEPNKHNPQRLVTNQTSQGDLDGKLVSNQSSPSLCNQEEEDPFEEAPWLATVRLTPQLGLNGAVQDGPSDEMMSQCHGGGEEREESILSVVKSPLLHRGEDIRSVGGSTTNVPTTFTAQSSGEKDDSAASLPDKNFPLHTDQNHCKGTPDDQEDMADSLRGPPSHSMITTPVQHHVIGRDNEKEDNQHSPHTPKDIVTNHLPPIQ